LLAGFENLFQDKDMIAPEILQEAQVADVSFYFKFAIQF
jgi:hypothetical protein